MKRDDGVRITIIPELLDPDGCIRFACALVMTWSYRYRKAYYTYLKNQSPNSLGEMRKFERKLKGPIANLTDGDIKKIQRQVEFEDGYFGFPHRY